MATNKTKPVTVRLPNEIWEYLDDLTDSNLREFIEAIVAALKKGEIEYRNGVVHGLSTEASSELDLSDLEVVRQHFRLGSQQRALDFLTSKALGGY